MERALGNNLIDQHMARARRLRRIVIRRGLRTAARAIARRVRRSWAAWSEFRDHHRRSRELGQLDRRQLEDIGLAPGDLPAIADGSYFRDPTRRARAPANDAQWIDRRAPGISQTTL